MGLSSDYPDVPDWASKPEGYQKGDKVKYQGNIFQAAWWLAATNPPPAGEGDPNNNGWRLYDELYDVTTPAGGTTEMAKIIGYLPTWRTQDNPGFDYGNSEMYQYLTHAIIAFLMFDENQPGEFDQASVEAVQAVLPQVVSAGHAAGTSVCISLGGATDYAFLDLMTAVGNDAGSPLLETAVQNVADFVGFSNLDGVDLDLECWWDKNGDPSKDQGGHTSPVPAGRGLAVFAQKLKEALPGKLVSATVFGTSWYGNNYDPALAEHVDWFSVMTYDLTGSWNQTPVGPHTALYKINDRSTDAGKEPDRPHQEDYAPEQQGEWPESRAGKLTASAMDDNPIFSVEDCLWYWTNPLYMDWQGPGQKLPRNKMVAGVPLYGYDFAYPKDPDQSGQTAPGYKIIPYKGESGNDILSQFPDAATAANASIKVPGTTPRPPFISAPGAYPYAHNIYFETPATAVAKLDLLKQVGVQGVIIWDLAFETWDPGQSITRALYEQSGNPATRPALPPPGLFIDKWSGNATGQAWSPEQSTGYETHGSPALAVYNGTLYALYEGAGGRLMYTSFTGTGWTPEADTGGRTHGAPALAVYQGRLHALHEGAGEDAALWWIDFDGTTWSPDVNTGRGTTGPGALAVFHGKLFCVHPGSHRHSNDQTYLWWTAWDGSAWSPDTNSRHGTGGTPNLIVYKGGLYCAHEGNQGGNADGRFWWAAFDDISGSWSDTDTGNGTSGAPAVAIYDDTLYALHEGHHTDGNLWMAGYDGQHWLPDQNTHVAITAAPAVTALDQLYCLHQGPYQSGELDAFSYRSGLWITGDAPVSGAHMISHTRTTPTLAPSPDGSTLVGAYQGTTGLTWTSRPTQTGSPAGSDGFPSVAFWLDPQGNGNVTEYDSYPAFIRAVRGLFRPTGNSSFTVRVVFSPGQEGESSSPWIRIRASDFYMIALNPATSNLLGNGWQDITDGRYQTYPSTLDGFLNNTDRLTPGTFRDAFRQASTWSANPPGNYLQSGTVALLSFLVSEAARFDIVQFTVDAMLSNEVDRRPNAADPRYFQHLEWLSFRGLLNEWGPLSIRWYNTPRYVPIPMRDYMLGNDPVPAEARSFLLNLYQALAALGYRS